MSAPAHRGKGKGPQAPPLRAGPDDLGLPAIHLRPASAPLRMDAAIIQGQILVGGRIPDWPEDTKITTVLGSCVSACLFDPVAGIGGMNHFMLPGRGGVCVNPASYGAYAMALLINALLCAGAERAALRAKVFGGAAMIGGSCDVGQRNSGFVKEFLRSEGIQCLRESLGGARARRITFDPVTGSVRQTLPVDHGNRPGVPLDNQASVRHF